MYQKLIQQLQDQLELSRNRYAEHVIGMKLVNPEYASLISADTLTLEDVQEQVLDGRTTLIEYFVLDDHIVVWVIDQQSFELVNLHIDRDYIRRWGKYLRKYIAHQDFNRETAANLYKELLVPLKPHIRHRNLVVVPHDGLHYLPFAALWDEEASRYLVQEYTLTYAPSASVLKFIRKERDTDALSLLALGNPDGSLDQAEEEVKAIAKLYGATPLLGSDATEQQVVRHAAKTDLLHLSAHGVYDEINPLFTRIELAKDEVKEQDGNLEVHEVYGLDLSQANLVVLSACETALGPQSAGDEIVGLTRAFLTAGTPAVITTLWSVEDDASSVLMVAFYRHLQAGSTNAEALRAAQMEVLAQERWQSPYYWAAFSLTGDHLGNGQLEGSAVTPVGRLIAPSPATDEPGTAPSGKP